MAGILETLVKAVYHSPCGNIYLGAVADGLCFAEWVPLEFGEDGGSDILVDAVRELDEYFVPAIGVSLTCLCAMFVEQISRKKCGTC